MTDLQDNVIKVLEYKYGWSGIKRDSQMMQDLFKDIVNATSDVINKSSDISNIISTNEESGVCHKCRDTGGFYLGATCPKCNRPFRSVMADER